MERQKAIGEEPRQLIGWHTYAKCCFDNLSRTLSLGAALAWEQLTHWLRESSATWEEWKSTQEHVRKPNWAN